MIDIENAVFGTVANDLRAKFPGITIYDQMVETPEKFPCVSLVESNNAEVRENKTLARTPETACELMYIASAYSNLQTGKKAQAKAIINAIDACMRDMGFSSAMQPTQLPNLDRTIFRMVATYTRVYQTF